MAVEFGILPWTKKLVLKCVKRCYFDARRLVRTPEDLQRSGLKILAKKIDGGALITVGKRTPSAKSFCAAEGYVIAADEDQKVVVRAEKFKAWFPDRRQVRLVMDWLRSNDLLKITGSKKARSATDVVWAETQKTWPHGKRVRSIAFDLPLGVRNSLPR